MVNYFLNWMGPAAMSWYQKRDLDPNTQSYSCGRVDVRDFSKEGYEGWDEYSVPPMKSEDWRALAEWLSSHRTREVMSYEDILERFEEDYGKKVEWWNDD